MRLETVWHGASWREIPPPPPEPPKPVTVGSEKRRLVVALMADGEPRASRSVAQTTGMTWESASRVLCALEREGVLTKYKASDNTRIFQWKRGGLTPGQRLAQELRTARGRT